MEPPSDVITFSYDCTAKEHREGAALISAPLKGKGRQSAKSPTQFGRGIYGWLLWAVAAIVFYIYLKRSGPPAPPLPVSATAEEADSSLVILSELALVAGFICLGVAVILTRFVSRKTQPSKRHVEFSITPEGLVARRPGMTITTRWDSFRGLEEGDRVLILRSDLQQATVIPKRLFANDLERARAIEILRGYTVRTPIPFTGAFPVIQR